VELISNEMMLLFLRKIFYFDKKRKRERENFKNLFFFKR